MKIDILTLFPQMFEGFLKTSILKRALEKGLVKIKIWDLRKFGLGPHKQVDDRPYGGGAGMVMRVDIIDSALSKVKRQNAKLKTGKTKIILLTPAGKLFNQKKARSLSQISHLILICGHYEGVDERVRKLVDQEISIGDYVLTGGELPAAVLIDAVVRHIPGVLGKKESLAEESFSPVSSNLLTADSKLKTSNRRLLEYPQYTRPEKYKGLAVPKILLSGNHAKIRKWRENQALKKTKKLRPDLLK